MTFVQVCKRQAFLARFSRQAVEQKLLPPIASARLSVTKVPQASHLTINAAEPRPRRRSPTDLPLAGLTAATSRLRNVSAMYAAMR